MWTPSHAHVLVQRAENLLAKGKNGTNNAFVVIELGKESYRTSVKEKSGKSVVWNEECELKIPKAGNTAFLILTAFHRNSLGLDEFLGTVKVPLLSFDKISRRSEWFTLEGKPGKEKGKDKVRGKLEVEIGFLSKVQSQSQSLTSLRSKGKGSSGDHLSGSLFALTQSDIRHLKLKTLGSTLQKKIGLKKKQKPGVKDSTENDRAENSKSCFSNSVSFETCGNLDPGVVSDDEDNLSKKSSESFSKLSDNGVSASTELRTKSSTSNSKNPQISISLCDDSNKPHYGSDTDMRQATSTTAENLDKPPKLNSIQKGLSSSCIDIYANSNPKPEKKFSSSLQLEINQGDSSKKLLKFAKKLKHLHSTERKEVKRTVIGCEAGSDKLQEGSLSPKSEFKNKNKDELIKMVTDLQKRVNCVSIRVKDLEEYLDEILLKVMDTAPTILEKS